LGGELPGHGNVPAVAKGLGLTELMLYAVAATISIPFVWSVVRETKGKTLEEM
jgi:diphthamide biosynthesis methyltransferase